MTVAELVEKLHEFPSDIEVEVWGDCARIPRRPLEVVLHKPSQIQTASKLKRIPGVKYVSESAEDVKECTVRIHVSIF